MATMRTSLRIKLSPAQQPGHSCTVLLGRSWCIRGRSLTGASTLAGASGKGFGSAKTNPAPPPKKQPAGIGKPGGTAPKKKAARSFQGLMYAWDDVFTHFCETPALAAQLAEAAAAGHAAHGRGCLFVRATVTERFSRRGIRSAPAATQGWVAAPQQPLTCNEDLLLGEYRADFIPEATVAELSSSVSYVEGAGMVPDAGTLLAAGSRGNAPSSGSGAAGGASTAPKGADACGGAGSSGTAAAAARSGAIEAGTARSAEAAGVKEELLRAMRGMDPAQLRAYISGGDAPGYNASAGELVLLLVARVSGAPMIGADIVQSKRSATGEVTLVSPQLEGLLP